MTEITYDPTPPSAQHEANNAHYALAKAVREMLPKFCKDPDKCDELCGNGSEVGAGDTATEGHNA